MITSYPHIITGVTVTEITEPVPKSVLEALQQRHKWYQAGAGRAKEEQNAKKERRMMRLANTYTEAITGDVTSVRNVSALK